MIESNIYYEDQEDGNLSWLLNFKLDSFIDTSEEKSTVFVPQNSEGFAKKTGSENITEASCTHEILKRFSIFETPRENGTFACISSSSTSMEYQDLYIESKKPPFTYTELIEHALLEQGELTVSAIYQWITDHFPYFKNNDDRWKNSVRHNLSINPHFRKGSKAPHGAGHLWTIARQDESKLRQFVNNTTFENTLKREEDDSSTLNSKITAVKDFKTTTTNSIQQNVNDKVALQHCAEQILSGIKKDVEVQYVLPITISNNRENMWKPQNQSINQVHQYSPVKEEDFLNPVAKDIVVEKCGLLNNSFFVTDLSPSTLGFNMTESEIIIAENPFSEGSSTQIQLT